SAAAPHDSERSTAIAAATGGWQKRRRYCRAERIGSPLRRHRKNHIQSVQGRPAGPRRAAVRARIHAGGLVLTDRWKRQEREPPLPVVVQASVKSLACSGAAVWTSTARSARLSPSTSTCTI